MAGEDLPGADEVIDHLDDLYRSDSSRARLRMEINAEFGERRLEMESWTRGTDYALVVIRAPAREAGTATLRTDEGLWNYAPRADRLMRIPSGLLSDSWMGSHFTNDDLMRETSYREDYESALEWDELDGERHLKVVMTPRPDAPVVFTRIDFYLTAQGWTPVRTEYFEGANRVRTMTFSDVREISNRAVPHTMELRPEDRPEEFTRVEYIELDLEADVDQDLFTRRGLRRVARP